MGGRIASLIPITALGNIVGSPYVGSVISCGATTPSAATKTYQWSRSTTSGGAYTNILGATSNTYTVVSGDIDYYLKVTVTGTGSYTGTITSSPLNPITLATPTLTFLGFYGDEYVANIGCPNVAGAVNYYLQLDLGDGTWTGQWMNEARPYRINVRGFPSGSNNSIIANVTNGSISSGYAYLNFITP